MNITRMIQLVPYLAVIVCYVCIGILLWKCYRRTGNWGFILLGGAILIWPTVGFVLNPFVGEFVEQAAQGQQPWLFPFSLMGGPDPKVTVGEFVLFYRNIMTLAGAVLVAASLVVMTRAFSNVSQPLIPRSDRASLT